MFFGIIWFVFVVAIGVIPPILEARKKGAKKAASEAEKKAEKMKREASARQAEMARAAAQRKRQAARKIEVQMQSARPKTAPASTTATAPIAYPHQEPTPEVVSQLKDRKVVLEGEKPKRKIVKDLREMVIYSEILKPKFDDV